jgi:hypothetical protein
MPVEITEDAFLDKCRQERGYLDWQQHHEWVLRVFTREHGKSGTYLGKTIEKVVGFLIIQIIHGEEIGPGHPPHCCLVHLVGFSYHICHDHRRDDNQSRCQPDVILIVHYVITKNTRQRTGRKKDAVSPEFRPNNNHTLYSIRWDRKNE